MDLGQKRYINCGKIIEDCEVIGVEVTWRTLNYYKSLGLLPKSTRIKGDKKGYYPSEIIDDLVLYHFLQNDIGFTLKEIKELRDGFQVVDKYIDSKKSTAYSVVGNFAYIINLTYGAYMETIINDPEIGRAFRAAGVTAVVFFNHAYKNDIKRFPGTIISLISRESITKENCEDIIKEWGRKTATDFIEGTQEMVKRLIMSGFKSVM